MVPLCVRSSYWCKILWPHECAQGLTAETPSGGGGGGEGKGGGVAVTTGNNFDII